MDERLAIRNKRREAHLKRALNFVEQGIYVKEEEKLNQKEERKVIAGYASGRKAPEKCDEVGAVLESRKEMDKEVPPPSDVDRIVPVVEWWDEVYLPKNGSNIRNTALSLVQIKQQLQLAAVSSHASSSSLSHSEQGGKTTQELVPSLFLPSVHDSSTNNLKPTDCHLTFDDFYSLLSIINAKTHKLVQHPVPIKPLGGEAKEEIPLPLYLTQKERKRIRKQAREERELEKRDKMAMGLIPAAEPKFKLSNFMKILGDQAVADPSKIEQKVMEQMKKRELNHEMRNQARKLTPQERKEKEKKKNMEDTSKCVHVGVFKVNDLSDKKKQFKIDVTAQEHYLSGIVLISTNADVPNSVVIVEGGPQGIKAFTKLMTKRYFFIYMLFLCIIHLCVVYHGRGHLMHTVTQILGIEKSWMNWTKRRLIRGELH